MEYDKILERLLKRHEYFFIGNSIVRTDALDKALGKAKFTADYIPKGTVVVKVVRSTVPHAHIKRLDITAATKVPGVLTVLTAADIPGQNQIGYALPDQPLLNIEKVHYIGDPLALVCAKDEHAATDGIDAVKVEYDPLSASFTIASALENDVSIHENGNIAVKTRIRKGNIAKGFSEAKVEVKDTYETSYQEHMCLETEAAYAIPEGTSKVTVIGTMQSPFLVREKVAYTLGWRLNQVRVIQALTGGAFGRKDDMGPLVCAKAALAAVRLRQPAAIVFDREESIAYAPKRYPACIKYRSGADKKGRITAVEVDITLDCGAYANRAPFWLWRQTAHAAGPYAVPNVSVDGRAVYTNNVYGGSFRGFGNVSMHFAIESQIDRLAAALDMDPVEFRLANILRAGARTTCDQHLDHSVGMEKCLRGVTEASAWNQRERKKRVGNKIRGLGVGCAYHGISTSRSTPDWSAASLILNEDGSLTYRTGICELGQGSPVGHAKIVAECLGVPVESIRIEIPDTDSTPNAKPTHGSRGLMVGGTAAAEAALKLRQRVVKVASAMLSCAEDDIDLREGRIFSRQNPAKSLHFSELAQELYTRGVSPGVYGFYAPPKRFYDPETGLGVNYSVYTFTASIAEVEVDAETGQVAVIQVWPGMDVGRAIDPMLIEGQMQGAVSQGIGFALMERLVIKEGKVLNPNFKDYVIPSACDTPEIAPSIIVEEPYKHSAFGAKGVGEPAIISIVPAIANAVYSVTGTRFNTLPITAEKVLSSLRRKGA